MDGGGGNNNNNNSSSRSSNNNNNNNNSSNSNSNGSSNNIGNNFNILGTGSPSLMTPTTSEDINRRRLMHLERIRNVGVPSSTTPAAATTPLTPQTRHLLADPAPSTPTPPSTPRVQIMTPPKYIMNDDIFDDENAELQAALALSLESSTVSSTAATNNNNNNANNIADNNDDDDDLQAALALSLQQDDTNPNDNNNNNDDNNDDDRKPPAIIHRPATAAFTSTSSTPIKQDAKMPAKVQPKTTPTRTIETSTSMEIIEGWWKTGRPCDILAFHSVMWDSNVTTDADKRRWIGQGINFRDYDPEGKLTVDIASDSLLGAVISNHGPWGLTQHHGGPCGVLAAVQAELLRILLFGPRNPLDYPSVPHNNVAVSANPDMSEKLMLKGLAMAIAMILARAALTPPASEEEREEFEKEQRRSVTVVLPTSIPSKQTSPMLWEDFEPWAAPTKGIPLLSAALRSYTIEPPFSSAPKRQKTNGNQEPLETRINELAHAVATFLIDAPPQHYLPLDYFQRPGGVILLVMSLAFSRGIDLLQLDMDDPLGARLTTQFGHCGQELINLLLTGQAVSNVFDNTLKPSGELTCRGVQYRPTIGYLTQLEAMRYCEVGGYYKTPRFPIWVVGSTSHFTVMFGSAHCLKESQSDVLLEKCRRAFKAIEGGEENGFIATQHLGTFLKSLDVTIPEHGIQALAATIEVHGAGIILWDDLWKHTSRLMMGASLENVLALTDTQKIDDDDGPPPLMITQFGESDDFSSSNNNNNRSDNTNNNSSSNNNNINDDSNFDKKPSAQTSPRSLSVEWDDFDREIPTLPGIPPGTPPPAAAGSPMDIEMPLSDEELARKLQEEWNAEAAGGSGATITSIGSNSAVRGSPTPANWKNLSLDDTSTVATRNSIDTINKSSNSSSVNFNMNNNNNSGSNNSNNNNNATSIPSAYARQDYEKPGQTFQLFHYNGLRGGALQSFRVTRMSAEEAVGASISLLGNHQAQSNILGGGNGLEDVIRTKWPSCMINWLGHSPPSID